MKALKIKSSGETELLDFTNETCYTTLSSGVGGLIECVCIAKDLDMWVNEEGKNLGLPYNPLATRIFAHTFGNIDPIAGDIVLTGGVDEDGNTLGISSDTIEEVYEYLCLTV